MGDLGSVAYIMEGLAMVAGRRGEPERSARHFAAAEGLIEQIGLRGPAFRDVRKRDAPCRLRRP